MELRNCAQHFLASLVVSSLHHDFPAELLVRQECATVLVFELRIFLVYDLIGMGYEFSNHN